MAIDHAYLSDGEILSENEAEDPCSVATTPVQKDKEIVEQMAEDHLSDSHGEDAQSSESDGGGWVQVIKGPRKRKSSSCLEEKKKKKKKRRRAPEMPQKLEVAPIPSSFLSSDQRSILSILCELVKPISNSENGTAKFKTADLQAVLRHLILGDPSLSKKGNIKRAAELRMKRILVVWLSNVSKSDFCSSDRHFSGLKAVKPSVQFSIMHPGSDTFVKFGLEAFMEIENPASAKVPQTPMKQVSLSEFSRLHCLLSTEQMKVNKYPIPTVGGGVDLPAGYFKITDWPEEPEVHEEVSTYPLFSIDCEMVETEDGEEALARVSVVDEDLQCIYSELVKPDKPVKDYRTQFSGVSESMLKDVLTMLNDVQKKLKKLLPSKCILVGHSLECDFNALKLCHPYVIDTSVLFSPNATPMHKPGLKHVTKKIMDIEIQNGSDGHNPTEDAMACMKLLKKKLESGPKLVIKWRDNKSSLLNFIHQNGKHVGMVDKQTLVNLFARGIPDAVTVGNDEEAVAEVGELMIDTQFTFVQLHSMEQYRKDTEAQCEETYMKFLDSLDALVCEIISSCCQGTLVFVICGSGYIGKVMKLQKSKSGDLTALKKEVEKARTGHVFTILK